MFFMSCFKAESSVISCGQKIKSKQHFEKQNPERLTIKNADLFLYIQLQIF